MGLWEYLRERAEASQSSPEQRRLRAPDELRDVVARVRGADYVIETGGGSLVGKVESLQDTDAADSFIEVLLTPQVVEQLRATTSLPRMS